MMKNFKLITLLACLLFSLHAFAQEEESIESPGSLNEGTIESQFDYLNRISNNYQDYKVIKRVNIDKIRKNISDSLNVFRNEIIAKNTQIKDQKAQLDQLNANIDNLEQNLQETIEIKDSFSFMGMHIHKSTYSKLMWILVFILLGTLLFFLYLYNRSHSVTAEIKRTLDETKEEFEQHRKNTLERERKLNRQLVDEMNKRLEQG
ncbi:hypothetical protein [Pararhodonellum marinum]|uniref:hypothetical protein n=1 Tax=Pararhodonellum marinum TaxID=2755358 RepID=UPI001E53C0E5|nr:hypothetical protein [Pararhodonellum marinum]